MILNKDFIEIFTQSQTAGITSMGTTAIYSGMGKVQPAQALIEGSFDGMGAFEVYEIYTYYMDVKIGDKIINNGKNYYVKGKEDFTGILRSYTKCLCNTKFD